MMTFDDARKKQLQRFDRAVEYVRAIASDPSWCNEDYKPFKEHLAEIISALKELRQLNNCEETATRVKS